MNAAHSSVDEANDPVASSVATQGRRRLRRTSPSIPLPTVLGNVQVEIWDNRDNAIPTHEVQVDMRPHLLRMSAEEIRDLALRPQDHADLIECEVTDVDGRLHVGPYSLYNIDENDIVDFISALLRTSGVKHDADLPRTIEAVSDEQMDRIREKCAKDVKRFKVEHARRKVELAAEAVQRIVDGFSHQDRQRIWDRLLPQADAGPQGDPGRPDDPILPLDAAAGAVPRNRVEFTG